MKAAFIAVALFIACLVLYQSNGDVYTYSYDSFPNSVLVFNALENHRTDFDNFRTSYLASLGASYVFVPGKDGRLTSLFPIGTAILSAPLYVAFDVQLHAQHQPIDLTSIAFERVRLHFEKWAANILAALAAVLFFFCARRLGGTRRAIVATAFFAAGTEMWTIGSQALWQHGPVNLVVLGMVAALLAALDARTPRRTLAWLVLAGLCAGFLPVVRPTALIFLGAGGAFAAWQFRRAAAAFAAGALVGIMPAILWNEHAFGTLLGGYDQNAHNYVVSAPFFVTAIAGELISPSKGLFVFTPLFVFALIGLYRAMRVRAPEARLLVALAAAGAVLVLNYGFYVQWWGGFCFGDRFLADIACVGALLVVYAIPARTPARMAFGVVFAASVAVQFVGANGDTDGHWSAVPVSVNVEPSRVWALDDSAIQRDATVTLRRILRTTKVVQGAPGRPGNGAGP